MKLKSNLFEEDEERIRKLEQQVEELSQKLYHLHYIVCVCVTTEG